ncbi:S-methyl-5-thioribose-1-phosphate isomerase [Carboxydothermus hydrogenoformans]|uniref:Methylthioribose-1-phosphate isomerase n=1 Tax=Carboxydothermus hydrogenoformans (strain ATCC BAA-161 / DSM 6008 / Z-2901) TaxID=246194 RepID=MTNA_CARHZ|nr:S-methyl-5-thioribose-1-phosphate isomerase [Carboxydothermus hydrogenoformans]Q3ABU6.1 RecName: Full=Methylthioribose-1-phosphate isomerase; Short=M1Pi; Short=MTR-1-P isomerase; AltName: Full=S-methyl-5-thioribose-1-phosphate isomerase [Carboxydothermus hydrogenoformans Z-2901]ABB14197.1 putative translation initiation factor, aIF-2BI family [Carboxydothermus hydrogenoformans Z-2901]
MDTMYWKDNTLFLLDQTKLPIEVKYVKLKTYEEVAEAIVSMKVRGAPAIGAAAAYGMVLGVMGYRNDQNLEVYLKNVYETLKNTRPTAVNLFWALDRMWKKYLEVKNQTFEEIANALLNEANSIFYEDIELNKKIGAYGLEVVPENASILTHCNAGALATAGYGTALGVVRAAFEAGKLRKVFADETRPLLQGARLTAFELLEDGIDVTLICDNMAGYVMSLGLVDLVVVGADRVTANGDVANKIGTYSLAILAKEHGIPFYVAAPYSTIDLNLTSGQDIPIEERNPDEVRKIGDRLIAPPQVKVFNPAFDVTPAKYITGIITDRGIVRPPYKENIKKLFGGK